jgi:hypothetical protein
MKKLIVSLMLISLFAGGSLLTAYAQNESKQASATQEANGINITRLVVGTGVDNREPLGVAETFPSSTGKVICFLSARNITKDTEVTFVWILKGKELLKTNLVLKSGPQWRTRADKKLNGQKGDWKVEIRNAAGNVLKDVQFKVE